MPEYDIVGTSVPLGKKVTDPPTHNAPKPTAQLVGDNVPLGRTPVYPPTHTLHQQGSSDPAALAGVGAEEYPDVDAGHRACGQR
jgi:hypothetical protein